MAGNDTYTKLLIRSDTSDGSTTFIDSSSVARTITVGGDTHHESDQAKFGATSIYFDGTGDYLTTASASDLAFGAGDFTVDLWIRLPSLPANSYIFDFGVNGGTLTTSSGKILFYNASTGTGGALYTQGPTLSINTWYHVALVRYSGTTTMYVDGVSVASQTDSRNYPAAILSIGQYGAGGYNYVGYIDEFRVSVGIARWTASFTPPSEPYTEDVAWQTVLATLDQLWGDVPIVGCNFVQEYGLKTGYDLVQSYADAPVVQLPLLQPYGDAGLLVAPLVQRWRDMVILQQPLAQPWAITESLAATLAQAWAITADVVQSGLAQSWSIDDVEPLQSVLHQPWAIAPDNALLTYTVQVLANGMPVGTSHLNIESDLGQDVLTCEIHPGSEPDYLRCPIGATLEITVTAGAVVEVYRFVVTSPRLDEQWGQTRYIVEAMSPAAMLGEPWATPIDGELSGMAATIASTLAGSITISWQTVDWPIPAATWIASGQTPLALIKQLAAAVGAVVQSQPDGSLMVLPEYPVSVPSWESATPAATLTEILDCATTGATPDHRLGYNRYLVGDQATSADTLRLEETTLSQVSKEVRGYQTPWTGAFTLTHTGGAWVQIEDLGIELRQETETIEIVGGAGRTQYPIVSRDAIEWLQTNLGSVTVAEDGGVIADLAGQSLLLITYTTRCRLWRVADPRNEQLQLVATHE